MDENCAHTIAGWHYEGVYAFYDMGRDIEDLQELLDPHSWTERYYAVTDEQGELVGFFCFEHEADAVAIGLGLRPDLTGQGRGLAFLEAGLEFARGRFGATTFRLSVATFNQRAIRVYRRAGFQDAGVFVNETNGGVSAKSAAIALFWTRGWGNRRRQSLAWSQIL
ncbi:MAG: GNAT family N-acetyltransferase [Chloroflexia bacterium]|nr:GNAT family N-acetyltransferase [Chloroflexia bacterium]